VEETSDDAAAEHCAQAIEGAPAEKEKSIKKEVMHRNETGVAWEV
jgi:hypothetical protein